MDHVRVTRKRKLREHTPCLICLEPCTEDDAVETFPCCGTTVHAHCLQDWAAASPNRFMACLVCKHDTSFTVTRAALQACDESRLLRVVDITLRVENDGYTVPLLRVRWAAPSDACRTRQLVARGTWEAHTFEAHGAQVVFYDIGSSVQAPPWVEHPTRLVLRRFPMPMATCAQHYCTPSRRHLMVPLGRSRRVADPARVLVQSLASDPSTRAQRVLVHRARAWCLFSQDLDAKWSSDGWTRDAPRGLPVARHHNIWYPAALRLPPPAKPAGCMLMNVKYYGPKPACSDTRSAQATLQAAELARICNNELRVLMHIMLSGAPPAAGEAARGAEPELPAGGAHHVIA